MAAIPAGITRKDVMAALVRLDRGEEHPFGPSTKFDLVYEEKRYPPKAVVALAAERLAGKRLRPADFSGGKESQCFRILEKLGFVVEEKAGPGKTTVWRQNPQSARKVLDGVFTGQTSEVRKLWEAFLAASIDYAVSRYPDRAVVVLEPGYVSTTVGMVRCLKLDGHQDQIVLLDRKIAPRNTRWSGGIYEFAPGCEEAYISKLADARALGDIRGAHFTAIDACGQAHAGNSQRRRAHSTGVLRYLESQLGVQLPDPSYVAESALSISTVAESAPQFWWVNHKQTHRQEIEGEYLWSPKKNQNGANNESYNNMTKVLSGDIVFSYSEASLRAIGLAKGRAWEAPKPIEFEAAGDQWGTAPGWQVPVTFVELAAPLRVKAHAKELAPALPKKHSPIRASGDGNQGVYLAAVPTPMAAVLRRLLGGQLEGALSQLEGAVGPELADEVVEERIQQRTDIGPTQKARLINARRGQGIYRDNLEQIEKCCRITGISDGRYLRASHIKPWCKSDDQEKLDGYNGLLLAPHVDLLFDRGWISFSDDGKLLLSERLDLKVLAAWGIPKNLNVGKFRPEQCHYLAWHREKFGFGS